ncbi:MAG: hypothetical protein CSA18_00150 [Deltaproteobacteria bacterium]|nr:MAG: hypothetical protein CSA18_00150 [Deltaproteobacteria bacterium]
MRINQKVYISLTIIFFFLLIHDRYGHTSILYKEYIILNTDKSKYLCSRHVVRPDEYIYKILKTKNVLDVNVLLLFKKLNSHISDINKVEPGDSVFIPVKRVSPSEFKNYGSYKILIPFVTKKTIKNLLDENSTSYKVKKGDTVSQLIRKTMHINFGTSDYSKAEKLFKYLNPEIKNINLIHQGQIITLSKSNLINKEWYPSLFSPEVEKRIMPAKASLSPVKIPVSIPEKSFSSKNNILDMIANTINGKVMARGSLYIPDGDKMLCLNLKKTPYIKSKNFSPLFFFEKNSLNKLKQEAVKNFYAGACFFKLSNEIKDIEKKQIKHKKINMGNGVRIDIDYNKKIESTQVSSKKMEIYSSFKYYDGPYKFFKRLADSGKILPLNKRIDASKRAVSLKNINQKDFIKEIVKLSKYSYNENTKISFPFKGVQISTYTNIIKTPDDHFVIVDFSQFYGETIDSIKKLHMNVVQIKKNDNNSDILINLFSSLKSRVIIAPVIPKVLNDENSHVNIKLKGFLFYNNFSSTDKFLFFTSIEPSKFPDYILYYLGWLDITTIFI